MIGKNNSVLNSEFYKFPNLRKFKNAILKLNLYPVNISTRNSQAIYYLCKLHSS